MPVSPFNKRARLMDLTVGFLTKPVFRKPLRAGLDLGEHSLKYAVVDPKKGKIRQAWKALIHPDRTSKDDVVDEEVLRNRLIHLFQVHQKMDPDFQTAVNTAVQGIGTVCNYLEFPLLSDAEMEIAVQGEAIKHIPFPIEEMNLAYFSVPLLSSSEKKRAVFFAAAKKEKIEKFKTFLNSCGLQVLSIETPIFPLLREFIANRGDTGGDFIALVNVGFRYTQVAIVRDSHPYFAREFSLGGRDFIYALQMGMQVDWDEAENILHNSDAAERNVLIEPYLVRWMDEVKKSLDFFTAQFSEKLKNLKVQRLFLTGGTSSWKNLDKVITGHIGIPSEVDGLVKVSSKLEEKNIAQANVYKMAIGLSFGK